MTSRLHPDAPQAATGNDSPMTATITLDYCFAAVSPEFAAAFGRSARDCTAMPVLKIFGKRVYNELAKPGIDSCFCGTPLEVSQWQDLPARGICHLNISFTPVYDKARNIVAAHLCITDITAKSGAGEALQLAEAKFRSLFDNSPEPMLVSRLEDATVQAANEACLEWMGIGLADLISRDFPDLYCDVADYEKLMTRVKKKGRCSEFKTRMQSRDGAAHVVLSASHFEINGNACMVTVIRDVSAAHEAELSLQRSSRWLTLLQQVTEIANRGASAEDALRQSLEVFCTSLDSAVGHVYTLDDLGRDLRSSGIWYFDGARTRYHGIAEHTRPRPLQAGLEPGDPAPPSLPLLVPDLSVTTQDQRTRALLAHDLKSAIEIPVYAGGNLVALIELFSAKAPAFSTEFLEIFAQTAVQLSRVFERQEAHDRIAEEQGKFKTLVQDLDVIIWEMVLPGLDVNFVSDSGAELLGYSPKMWQLGKMWHKFIHPDDRQGRLEFYRSQSNGAHNHEHSYRFRTANGNYKWLTDVVRTVTDDHGKPALLRGVTYDISEQVHTRRALRQSEHRFECLFNDTPTIFFSLNARAEILAVNKFGANYLGYQVAELTDRDFISFIYESDRAEARSRVEQCFSNPGQVYRWQARQCTSDGAPIWLRISGRVIESSDQTHELLIVAEDVNETQRLAEELRYQATHDSLTGIINRTEFERQVTELLQMTDANSRHALCYLDLDQFKVINDACGHIAGDELLRQLTEKISARVRSIDTIARLGGDEFGILMRHCSMAQADQYAEQIRDLVESFRFVWDDKPFSIGASIGLVPIDSETGTFQELLRAADMACYAAKDSGRNRVHIYHSSDADLTRRRSEVDWVSKINQALEEDRLLIYMQPIMPLVDNPRTSDHCELLVRMLDDNNTIIPPGAFLPAAERFDLARKIDQWVIKTAFNWFTVNPDKLARLARCNINLSGQSVASPQLLDFILAQFKHADLPAEKFCFEITETAAIQNLATASKFMHSLQQQGCNFALDDFGSGLSSFSYLKQFPVDFLKIDGSFVKDMVNDPIDFAMVQSINDIGHVMGKQTVAEYVEDTRTLEALRKMGVDYAQGYGVSKPVPFILPLKNQRRAS